MQPKSSETITDANKTNPPMLHPEHAPSVHHAGLHAWAIYGTPRVNDPSPGECDRGPCPTLWTRDDSLFVLARPSVSPGPGQKDQIKNQVPSEDLTFDPKAPGTTFLTIDQNQNPVPGSVTRGSRKLR